VGVLLGASEGQGGKVDGAQVGVVDGGTVGAVVLGAMEGDTLDGIGVGLQSLTAVFPNKEETESSTASPVGIHIRRRSPKHMHQL
jgi:hypothetical protein